MGLSQCHCDSEIDYFIKQQSIQSKMGEFLLLNKNQRKPKVQSRMDNPQNLVTLGTEDEDKQNKKHNTEN